jgi:mannose-1-phosphate guanylyltransferase
LAVDPGYFRPKEIDLLVGTDKYTAFVRVRNTILVFTENANLILKKEFSQDVRSMYNAFARDNSDLLD